MSSSHYSHRRASYVRHLRRRLHNLVDTLIPRAEANSSDGSLAYLREESQALAWALEMVGAPTVTRHDLSELVADLRGCQERGDWDGRSIVLARECLARLCYAWDPFVEGAVAMLILALRVHRKGHTEAGTAIVVDGPPVASQSAVLP